MEFLTVPSVADIDAAMRNIVYPDACLDKHFGG